MTGQQGSMQPDGQWLWTEMDRIQRWDDRAVDNTGTLPLGPFRGDFHRPPPKAPRGPKAQSSPRKRPRARDEASKVDLDYGDE